MDGLSSDTDKFPPGPALFFNCIIDFFFHLLNFPQWRKYVPFGLADENSNRWLSYVVPTTENYPKLLSYSEFLSKTESNISVGSFYSYAFLTPSTKLGCINNRGSLLVLIILIVILRRIKSILLPKFCSIGRSVGNSSFNQNFEQRQKNQERITKFSEYVFRLFYHLSISLFGIWYFWDKLWWDISKGGTQILWLGYPNHPIEVGMTWYYLVQSAYNVEALISLVSLSFVFKIQNPLSATKGKVRSPIAVNWSPMCRGDFREMAIHHIITNILVIGSSHLRFTRIGSMVFLVHDISDVTVDLSKLANFVKWKLGTIIFFVSMVIFWAITRLGILPFVIFKSILLDSHMMTLCGLMHPLMFHTYHFVFTTLVGSIILLHIFWFFIIIRIGWRLWSKGETCDLSERDKSEISKVKYYPKSESKNSDRNITNAYNTMN